MGWVPLRRFANQAEAQIVAGFLRSEGIEARLPDEAFLAVHPEIGFSSRGGHRVEVPEGQHRRAHQLLAERDETAGDRAATPEARERPSGLLSLIRARLRGQ